MSFEEEDSRKIYEYHDWVKNTERAEIDGIEKIVLLPSFDLMTVSLAEMEAMVREIEFSKDAVGFEIRHNKWNKPRGGLARLDSFLRFLSGTSEAVMLPI